VENLALGGWVSEDVYDRLVAHPEVIAPARIKLTTVQFTCFIIIPPVYEVLPSNTALPLLLVD